MADDKRYFLTVQTGEHNPDGSVAKMELNLQQFNMDYGDYVSMEKLLMSEFLSAMLEVAVAVAKQKGYEVYDIDAIRKLSAGAAARRG